MITKNSFSMTVDSRSVNEGFLRSVVSTFATVLDPTVEEISDIKTAVSEVVTNCIVHAYPDKIGKIYIKCDIEGNILTVRIRDKGVGIPDVKKAMEPLYTTAGDERAGLGFAVMQSFMDHVKVRSKPEKGTTVTMKKHISVRYDLRR
ncbi:MAG: anti-sigma F factor [Clostridia bacterium]|nr:anti-sigma F factor [Clostridia bacterium]